jgi:hypothetical protein
MEATERLNYPYYIILGYTPPKVTFGILIVPPSDGCSTTTPRLALTQALQSRHVSFALKSLGTLGSHLHPLSLRSWFCGSTKWPDGFVMNHRKPRVQTPVVNRYPAPTPVHDFVLLFLPPCCPHLIPFGHRVHQAEPTCLSTPLRPYKAKTFCAHSSPAPTQIKLQPAPAILSQESVHTMLSKTHHTRERPSTGPRSLLSSEGPNGSGDPNDG